MTPHRDHQPTAAGTGPITAKETGLSLDWPAEAIAQVKLMLDSLAPLIPEPARPARQRHCASVQQAAPDWRAVVSACLGAGIDRNAAVRALRLHWPRRRSGRRPMPLVTKAITMRADAQPWRAVYPACIHGWDSMASEHQQLAAEQLRRRCASRLRQQKRRNRIVTPQLPHGVIGLAPTRSA